METATTIITATTVRHIGNYPVLLHEEFGEILLFPSVQELWQFQAAQAFRDDNHADYDHDDLVAGERAFNFLRDELGYDADDIMDWVATGDVAYRTSNDSVIWGAK